MTRTAHLESDLQTIAIAGVGARTLVAIPPSSVDPLWDEMRVAYANEGGAAVLISRPFDPGVDIVTGFPLPLLTEGGADLLTEASDILTTEVGA